MLAESAVDEIAFSETKNGHEIKRERERERDRAINLSSRTMPGSLKSSRASFEFHLATMLLPTVRNT